MPNDKKNPDPANALARKTTMGIAIGAGIGVGMAIGAAVGAVEMKKG